MTLIIIYMRTFIKLFHRSGSNFLHVLTFIVCCLVSFNASASITILPDDSKIQYIGRIDQSNSLLPILGWGGCEIRASFTGTSLKMIMSSSGEHYFNIIIDGNIGNPKKLVLYDAADRTYTLASGLADTIHTVNIFKRTPSLQEQHFKGFIIDDGATLIDLPPLTTRKIEFYGDSQLSGDAIECPTLTDSYESTYFNNYLAYGAVTARLLNAQYSCIAQGGAKLVNISGCFDKTKYIAGKSWDFSKWQADVVVINLGENDWPWTSAWNTNYVDFVKKVRLKYPKACIWLCLGPMFASVNPDFTNGIAAVKNTLNDSLVFTYVIKYSSRPHHPRVYDAAATANELAKEIRKKIWGECTPSTPTNVIASAISQNSCSLKWTSSVGCANVVGYEVYKDGIPIGRTTTNTIEVSGLKCGITYGINVYAYDADGNWSERSAAVDVTTMSCPNKNIAFNKIANVSSETDTTYANEKATDGTTATEWRSDATDETPWIFVNLGKRYEINRIKLLWSSNYATEYSIKVSSDSVEYKEIANLQAQNGGVDDNIVAGTGKFVGIEVIGKSIPGMGVYLQEVEIFGKVSPTTSKVGNSIINDLKIFPNPAINSLYIKNIKQNSVLKIVSSNGKTVHTQIIEGDEIVDVSKFEKGAYFFNLLNDKMNITKKVILR